MGLFSSIGSSIGGTLVGGPIGGVLGAGTGSINSVMGGLGQVVQPITGGLTSAVFGEEFKPQQYNIDQTAFTDPYSQQTMAQLQSGLSGVSQYGQNPYSSQQTALINALQGQASGTTPSVAQQALRQETDRNIQQHMGALASNRSVGAGLAARLAGQQGAQLQQQAVGQGALAQAQEKLQAQSNLANMLSQAQQGNLAGQQLQANMQQYYQNALMQKAEADRQARIQQQQLGMQNVQGTQGLAAQSAAQRQQLIGTVLGAAGSAIATGK